MSKEKEGQHDITSLSVKFWERFNFGICKVYFYKDNRIFYVVADENNMYLLHACRKQKNQTEKKDKKLVIKRAKELEKILGKTFV
ncbi:MAG: type II toxin-antitoxin system RelE/ParE family toxin [Clostridiales bacterium]|nr:type II toxin-antitoxin system RelE/ParE family toxin [Clostridiales bacterium]